MNRPSRFLTAVIISLTVVTLSGTAHAQPRLIVGARNLAMGGTGVGSASDSLATYYNPAGMAFSHGWEIQIPVVTVEGEIEGDILNNINELAQLFDESSLREIQERFNSGTPAPGDLETVLDAFLGELPDLDNTEDGAVARAAIGPAFRSKNWGVSTFVSASGGADALVDLTTGLSLSSIGMAGAIPDPVRVDACANDSTCLGYADDLVLGTGLDPARAEFYAARGMQVVCPTKTAISELGETVRRTTAAAIA